MRNFFLILIFFFICGCNKPSTVLICGDHQCINKGEAKQYFEDNLTLEVKIIDKKKINNVDLVELNLRSNENKKEIFVFKKENTDKILKVLSDKEIKDKKKELKNRNKNLLITKKKNKKKEKIKKVKVNSLKKDIYVKNDESNQDKIVNNPLSKIIDICTILEKCSIDEIS